MEVGKKYVHVNAPPVADVLECMYVAGEHFLAVMKNLKTNVEFTIYSSTMHFYKEYKEPRKIKKCIIVYESREGEARTYTAPLHSLTLKEAQKKGMYAGLKVLDIVDFEWTEKV